MEADDILSIIQSNLAQASTCLPAVVVKYDSSAQTVDVELAINRPYFGDNSDEQPVRLLKIPLIFPQGSDWVIAGDVVKGDAVLVHFSHFPYDNWINGDKSKVYPADSKYYHDIDSGFATLGAFSYNSPTRDSRFKNKFHIVQADNYITMEKGKIVITSSSGNARITMEGGKVTVDTDTVIMNADAEISGNLDVSGTITSPTMNATSSLTVQGQQMNNHYHIHDGDNTSTPQGGSI